MADRLAACIDAPRDPARPARAAAHGRAMVALYCAGFAQAPRHITLDIDDTFDAVRGAINRLRLAHSAA